jgi:hypothetical protein
MSAPTNAAVFLLYAHYRMSRSTTAVFPGRSGHNDDPYEDEEDDELTAAQKAEHARIRAGINARLAALQAEAKASRSVSAVRGPRSSGVGPRLTKKQKQTAALEKRRATIAAKAAAAAAAAEEEEEEEESEEEDEEEEAEGGAGSGPAAAAARYALPVAKNRSVRFFDMANTRRIGLPNARVLIRNRNTRKSTTRKPVIPVVNMRRSQYAANVAALFAKMSSWAVTNDPGYLTKVLLHIKKDPRYLDAHLTAKEREVLEAPGVLAKLERQAAMMNKE